MTKRQSRRPLRDPISVGRLLKAIQMLPPDRPLPDPLHWYLTQHEHWIGWLREYHTPGAYGRATSVRRDARYAYNHIVEVAMLVYLAKAAGVPVRRLRSAIRASEGKRTLMQRSGAFRREVPWETVAAALWPNYELSRTFVGARPAPRTSTTSSKTTN